LIPAAARRGNAQVLGVQVAGGDRRLQGFFDAIQLPAQGGRDHVHRLHEADVSDGALGHRAPELVQVQARPTLR
jgi:hypothetical protein